MTCFYRDCVLIRPTRVLGNRGTEEQRPDFEGNMGTRAKLWNKEHKKNIFSIFGEQGNKPINFRGAREWVSPVRASLIYIQSIFHTKRLKLGERTHCKQVPYCFHVTLKYTRK